MVQWHLCIPDKLGVLWHTVSFTQIAPVLVTSLATYAEIVPNSSTSVCFGGGVKTGGFCYFKQWQIRLCYASNVPHTSFRTESIFLISIVVFSGSTPSISICPAFCCALVIGLALKFKGKFAWLPITIATHCKKCCRENEREERQYTMLNSNKESCCANGIVWRSWQRLDSCHVCCSSHLELLFYTKNEMLWQNRQEML